MVSFQKTHHGPDEWDRRTRDGFRVSVFVDAKIERFIDISADTFLLKGRNMFFSYDEMIDSYCVLAKVTAPDGSAVSLRVDRDFYELNRVRHGDRETVASWQWSWEFKDFRLDELWYMMSEYIT